MAKPSTTGLVSGSSTVKVSLYGRVNQMVRFAATPDESALQALDNTHSGTRFGINASGSLDKDTSVTGTIEIGASGVNRAGSDLNAPAGLGIGTRRTSISLTHKDMGTVSVGHDWIAGSGAMVASFAGTSHVLGIWGPDGDGVLKGKRIGSGNIRAYGTRNGRILYRTPSLMGVSIEGSYNQSKGWSAGVSFSGFPAMKDISIALNAGYHSIGEDGDETSMGVSGGVKHNASGFNLNGSWGNHDFGKSTLVGWMVDAGWSGKVVKAGNTTLSAGYGVWNDGMMGENARYHFVVNQAIDAAATDLYLGVSYDSGDYTHTVNSDNDDMKAYRLDEMTGDIVNDDDPAKFDTTCNVGDVQAADKTKCAAERDGVFTIVAGILVKF